MISKIKIAVEESRLLSKDERVEFCGQSMIQNNSLRTKEPTKVLFNV